MNLRRSALASLGFSLTLATAAAETVQAQAQVQQTQQTDRASITGVVTDVATGAPLGFASVQLVGTAYGATTAADGRYTVSNIPPGIVTVRITRVGYSPTVLENLNLRAGAPTVRDVKMNVQALQLSQVVTTGMVEPGSGVRAPFSVAVVSGDKLDVAPVGSPLEALVGRVAGLQIRGGTLPGSDVVIQIRNPLSVTGFTQPLIIIDGVIQMQDDPTIGARAINGNPLDVSSENIESIEVVRGAAAAALYGQRAANGVINITTKRGAGQALGTTRMSLQTEAGVSQVSKNLPLMRSHQFLMDAEGNMVDAAGRPVPAIQSVNFVTDPDRMVDNEWPVPIYDNLSNLFALGKSYRNSLQLSQNSLSTNFAISGGAVNESGILREGGGSSQENVSVSIDYRGGNKLNAGIGISYGRTYISNLVLNADAAGGGNTNNAGAFLNAMNICKCVDIRAKDPLTGNYIMHPDGGGFQNNRINGANPLYVEKYSDQWDRRIGAQINASATYRPNSFLSFTTLGGYVRSDREEQLRWEFRDLPDLNDNPDGRLSQGEYSVATSMDEFYNANTRLGILTGMGGWTFRAYAATGGTYQKRNSVEVLGDTLTQNQPDFNFIREFDISSTFRETTSLDYTGNIALDYNQKYIVDLVYRAEGNSLLPPDTRWRANGRASAAWSMSEENWWPFADFTLFKPRYSIGTAGNNPLFTAKYELYTQRTGTGVTRIEKANLGNELIRPEEVTEQEFGLDMAFRNRFSLSLTYVYNTVKDQIRPDTILAFSGFDTQQTNLGDLRGDTYEATLEAQWIQKRNFRWSSSLVVDRSRQKITSYPRNCDTDVGNENSAASTYQRYCTGYVFGQIYGRYYVTDKSQLSPLHIASGAADTHFQVNDEGYLVGVGAGGKYTDMRWGQTFVVDNIRYEFGLPIFAGIYDADGYAEAEDSKVVGQGLPDFSFGFGNQLSIGNLSIAAQTVGQIGGQIYNQAKLRAMNRNNHAVLDQAGKPDYLKKTLDYYVQGIACCDADAAGVHEGNYGGLSSALVFVYPYFIENASFVKLSELRIAYRLNQGLPLLRKLGMTSGSIALVGRDLITIDSYSGYDPQISGSTDATTARVDRAVAPNYRNFTAQIRLVF